MRQVLNSTDTIEDTVLAIVSILTTCEFFDYMKENPSAWLGHLKGFDQILLAHEPGSLNTKLSMLLYYQSRYPALSRSLLRRKADPLASPEWRAVLSRMPLGIPGAGMDLALQVPELLERYDGLHDGLVTTSSEAEQLLIHCERLDGNFQK